MFVRAVSLSLRRLLAGAAMVVLVTTAATATPFFRASVATGVDNSLAVGSKGDLHLAIYDPAGPGSSISIG